MLYHYETHLHTSPVSACAAVDVENSLLYYKSLNYDGVFITNHFLDGNLNYDKSRPYEEQIEFYFSDYEKGLALSKKIGIRVFSGIEISYGGTDFLIYGLDKAWYLAHPEIMQMKKSEELPFFQEHNALVIQAHPFREASYIDHIRLYPRYVHGVEIINASRIDFENHMAELYAKEYGLIPFAGSDNHSGKNQRKLAGMCSDRPIKDEADFVERVKNGEMQVFCHDHGAAENEESHA